jgi:hypothetical protein
MKLLQKSLCFLILISPVFLFSKLSAQMMNTQYNNRQLSRGPDYNQYYSMNRDDEFLIDTSYTYVAAGRRQCHPTMSFDGTNYFIVWEDLRNCIDYDIYGARVTISGEILDSVGIPISVLSEEQWDGVVAIGDTNFFIVWRDNRNGSYDIYGARVSLNGVLIDTNGIAISTAVNDQENPVIAFDGTNFLVVWIDERSGSESDVYAARVNQSSVVLDTNGIPICTEINDQSVTAIAFDGTNYFIVWADRRLGSHPDIFGARVSQSGIVLDSTGFAICTEVNSQGGASIAFDGTNYFVVWNDSRMYNATRTDIYGTRVTTTGIVLDTVNIPISTIQGHQNNVTVAFDGTNYFCVWDDRRNLTIGYNDIYGTFVATDGSVLDSIGISIISSDTIPYISPFVIFDGVNYRVAWSDYRSGHTDIYGVKISPSGIILDSISVLASTSANIQEYSSSAFDGTNYLVVWEDFNNGSDYEIRCARISQTGVLLDTIPTQVTSVAKDQRMSQVAFLDPYYFAVWEDKRNSGYPDIYGARIHKSGITVDTNSICITPSSNWTSHPSVAAGDSNFFVVWADYISQWQIRGARISTSGVLIDTSSIGIATTNGYHEEPRVIFDGTNYFVTWKRTGNRSDIWGARVNQNGILLDTSGIVISDAISNQASPSVAFGGSYYFVAWDDIRYYTIWDWDSCDIFGARIDQSGSVIDTGGIIISQAPYAQRYPSVTFDGSDFIVAWQDCRNQCLWDIRGAAINTSGVVSDSFILSQQAGYQLTPCLVHGQSNRCLATYTGWTDTINGHSANSMRIWGKIHPFVGIEERTYHSNYNNSVSLRIYPNPMKSECNVQYIIPENTNVKISIYDISGRLIRKICHTDRCCGLYNEVLDLSGLSQGVYFIKLETKNCSEVKKIVFVK